MVFPLRLLLIFAVCAFSLAKAADNRNLSAQAAPGAKRVALVIGNGGYQYADILPKLTNPTHDAEDIAKALRGFGFEVIERKDQSLEGMNNAIAEFSRKIGNSDAALFYFAGHGLQVRGQNYLVPVDAKIETEARVQYVSVNVNQILDEMDSAKSRVNIVMLDACRNNPISGKFRSGATRGLAAPSSQPKGTVIVYATDPGNVAADGEGRNGLFTAGLLTAFKGGDLSLAGVLLRTSAEVERGSDQKQTPYINGPATLQQSFQFAAGTQVASLGPQVIGGRSAAQIEDGLWDAIKDSDKASVYEEYLKQYSKGRYLAQARVKIAQLKAEARQPAPISLPLAPTSASAKSDDPETQFWNAVKASGSRNYLDIYLTQYPKGKYVALAKFELKNLDDKDKAQRTKEATEKLQAAENEQQEALRAEQAAWEEAKAGTGVAGYVSYLEHYPKGSYAALAQVAQLKLQREATEREAQEVTAIQRQQDEITGREDSERQHGTVFKDCTDCPEMVVISAGVFDMGEIGSTHRVTVRKFALGKTEVTQGHWRATMGNTPSYFQQCGDECPVEQVNWNDAQEFVGKLSQKTGRSYRLPSEAEWEYACRAGERYKYCGGDKVDSVAWYDENSRKKTNPVAQKQPNRWGLYDMNGNVREWTEDCWNGDYRDAPADGTAWVSGQCSAGRVLRGGSWGSGSHLARSASRAKEVSTFRIGTNGFRVARTLP